MPKNAVSIVMLACAGALCLSHVEAQAQASAAPTLEQIVALERAALDRWITLDPQGYLDLYAPEVTYFDPQRDARVDGLEAMKTLLAPIKNVKLPFTKPRYDMIKPRLQTHGDVALLTFNLVSYGTPPGSPEMVVTR
jgi:ketosteroid isomerase-like protein